MPSTLVEFIEKDEIAKEKLEEFGKEFENKEIVDMNSLYLKTISFHHLLIYFVHYLL
jgi:hypothetical protein